MERLRKSNGIQTDLCFSGLFPVKIERIAPAALVCARNPGNAPGRRRLRGQNKFAEDESSLHKNYPSEPMRYGRVWKG